MKSFQEYIAEGKVVMGQPNLSEASSLKIQAHERISDLISLPLDERNAPFRLESAYESIREMFQSFLAADGYKAYSHEAIIAYAKEKKIINENEAFEADRIRQIRNDINYRALIVNISEANEAIEFADKLIRKLKNG